MTSYWERRMEETRRRRLAQSAGVEVPEPPRGRVSASPFGGGQVPFSNFMSGARSAGRTTDEMLFGPERESVLPGTQQAGRLERFIRDWGLSEQEFRLAGQRFGEGRPGAGLGWGALGLAGAVPFVGDVAQGVGRASRVASQAADVGRAADAARAGRGANIVDNIAAEKAQFLDLQPTLPRETLARTDAPQRGLREIIHRQGFDELPQIVDSAEFSRLEATGDYIPVYRGVFGAEGGQEAAVRFGEEFVGGEMFIGQGRYGNGVYLAISPEYALTYAAGSGRAPGRGAISRFLIPKNARLAEYPVDPKILEGMREAGIYDVNEYLAALGYDGIIARSGGPLATVGEGEVVLFNRSALVTDGPRAVPDETSYLLQSGEPNAFEAAFRSVYPVQQAADVARATDEIEMIRSARPFSASEAGFEYGDQIDRALAVEDVPDVMYHVAPRSARESIEQTGLAPQNTWNTGVGRWPGMTYASDAVRTADTLEPAIYRPDGVYMFENIEDAREFARGEAPFDIYEVRTRDISDRGGQIIRDPESIGPTAATSNTFVTRVVPRSFVSRIDEAADVGRVIPEGRWAQYPTAELVPTRWLEQFTEFERTGERVENLIPSIRERGFDDPLILEVGLNGKATLIEGNHRLAAARRLGLENVPVRVITARNVRPTQSGRGAVDVNLREGIGDGWDAKPSEIIADIPFGQAADVRRAVGPSTTVGQRAVRTILGETSDSTSVSRSVDSIVNSAEPNLLKLDSSTKTADDSYAAVVENSNIFGNTEMFIDRLTGRNQIRTGTSLDNFGPRISEGDAQRVVSIAREEASKFPTVARTQAWEPDAARFWEEQKNLSEWPEGGYNPFESISDYGQTPIQTISEVMEAKADVIANALSEINYFNIYNRVAAEVSPEAARAFAYSVGADYDYIPRMQEFLNSASVVVNVPESALEQIASSGRFYNQFTTGTSRGALSPDYRVTEEWAKMDVPFSSGPDSRPIYGYLAFPDLTASDLSRSVNRVFGSGLDANWAKRNLGMLTDGTRAYGDYAFVFKPEYKNSSTFMFGDSLGGRDIPAPLNNPSVPDIIGAGVTNIPSNPYTSGPLYVEAQIFSEGASVSDMIDYIVVRTASQARDVKRLFGDSIDVRVLEDPIDNLYRSLTVKDS